MKNYFPKLAGALLALMACQMLAAQNPIWTLPGYQYNHDDQQYTPLPQPSGSATYNGDPAEYVHAGYTGPDGELQVFTVDEWVYDKNGRLVGELLDGSYDYKAGFNERLILPMGDDCKRFAIIYRSSLSGSYSSQLRVQSLYMAVYDTEAINTWGNSNAVGALEDYNGNSQTLIDISKRDGLLYHQAGLGLYGYNDNPNPSRQWNSNLQIAASDLIDGCYYRVYVFDGNHLIKYHLTDNDLEWQGVIETQIPNASSTVSMRSEMELIKRSNGDYRIAIPTIGDEHGHSGVGVTIYDIAGSTGNTISSSHIYLDFQGTIGDADPYGLEFDATGQYLYISHRVTSSFPNIIDVYDVDNSSYSSLPLISNSSLTDFNYSFIERFGDDLFLASETHLGRLSDASNPGSATFNGAYQALSGTFLSSIPGMFGHFDRQILPDQIDMPYPDPVDDMSCQCCKDNIAEVASYSAESETWTPTSNPFNTGGGANVYIRDELRIPAGKTLTISGMNFYFGSDARVFIERGSGSVDGGHLILDGTLFSADTRCGNRFYSECQEGGECDDQFWRGVRVEGDDSVDQLSSGGIQGRFTMKGQSEIEFAHVGVLAGTDNCTSCGGGILAISDSKFKDNVAGVSFSPYVRTANGNETSNRSYIQKTNFTRTTDLPNDSKLVHVSVDNCSTIRLRGNIYQNEAWAGYTHGFRGTGIKSVNSSIDERWYCNAGPVIPCPDKIRSSFINLHKGIDASSSISARTLSAGYGIYTNNYIGIQASNLLRPLILDNEYRIINETNASGVKLIGCDQYAVENNFFTAMATSPVTWMFGITVQSSGPANNEIYRNRFEDITIGIVSSGQNADCVSVYRHGLRWKCNRFDQTIPYADIFVYSGNVSDEQGECDLVLGPARNIFSHTNGVDIRVRDVDLLTCGSAYFDIHYDYNEIPSSPSPLQARLKPLYYTNLRVVPYECSTQAGTFLPESTDCRVKSTSLDDIGEVMDIIKSGDVDITMDYFIEQAEVLYAASESIEDEGSASFSKAEYDFWTQLTQAYQWDTLGLFSAEAVFDLLNEYEPQASGEKFASILSRELGVETPDWISSDFVIIQDVENLPIANALGELPSVLNDVLNDEQLNSFSYMAALNALYASNSQSYVTVIPEPLDLELPEYFESGDTKSKSETDDGKVVVRPNPFEDMVSIVIDTDQIYSSVMVTVHDILGRRLTSEVYGERSVIEIDGSSFPSGVLIYSVYIDGTLFDTGKIVKAE